MCKCRITDFEVVVHKPLDAGRNRNLGEQVKVRGRIRTRVDRHLFEDTTVDPPLKIRTGRIRHLIQRAHTMGQRAQRPDKGIPGIDHVAIVLRHREIVGRYLKLHQVRPRHEGVTLAWVGPHPYSGIVTIQKGARGTGIALVVEELVGPIPDRWLHLIPGP